MSPSRRQWTIGLLATVAATVCFGVVPVFLRHFADPAYHLDVWVVNAVRYGIAAIFWLPFVLVLGRRAEAQAAPAVRRSIWAAALVPSVVNLLGQVGWAAAPYYLDAPTISFAIRTSFLFTIVLGFLFVPQERSLAGKGLFYVGVVACLVGTGLLFAKQLGGGEGFSPKRLIGLGIILWTALCWGGYAVSVRRMLRGYPFRLAFGVVCLYTSAGLAALMLMLGDYGRLLDTPLGMWTLLILSGFIGIAFGHVLLYRGIHGIGAVISSGVQMATPFVTCSAAAMFLANETLTVWQFLGGMVVVGGGLVLVKASSGRTQQQQQQQQQRVPPVVD